MSRYNSIQKEEPLKSLVFEDYFSQFGYEPNIDNIDFVITDKHIRDDLFSDDPGDSKHYLWAEAKKGAHDIYDMLTQLVLTCRKTYQKGDHLAPPWLGCFDEVRITFVAFHDMLPIFTETDFNWNTTPSNHETIDFHKAREKIATLIGAKMAVYTFGADDSEINEFIKTHFAADGTASIKSPITKDNFAQIFIKWLKEVKPFINISTERWLKLKNNGILDSDFYRVDIMSKNGNTITEKLKIVLEKDNYKLRQKIEGELFFNDIRFVDNGIAYSRFWNKYDRPPTEEYQQYIIDRRDLLVPQNIREIKGSFFTPKIWVDKSKEYLAQVFGNDWQDEYYVWDCAAGTGNLLVGFTNKYNVWASTIDQGDVETIQALIDIDEHLNLLPAHVFQFDFLNDSFDEKLPEGLKKIIDDPEKRKKLIMYINPPYAEGDSRIGHGRKEFHKTEVHNRYQKYLKKASAELFAQFLARIYFEIPGCKIGEFSTMKALAAPNFIDFRLFFKAAIEQCFVCPADTFDNVQGQFPIGFKIWDTEKKKASFKQTTVDVYDKNGTYLRNKKYYAYDDCLFISAMLDNKYQSFNDQNGKELSIGHISSIGNDFQHQNALFIDDINRPRIAGGRHTIITNHNLINVVVYYAVRKSIVADWLNDRDQFLYPHDNWRSDMEFQHNCLVYTLFNNNISSKYGVNHWIPFTEKEANAKDTFDSHFMSFFLKEKTVSVAAQAVLDAGKELWRYYHLSIKTDKTVSVNASFYDIREFFQGRTVSGKMNINASDETYNDIIKKLRHTLKLLTLQIEPSIYQYGFLKK
jgi:hypothetical protein